MASYTSFDKVRMKIGNNDWVDLDVESISVIGNETKIIFREDKLVKLDEKYKVILEKIVSEIE